MATIAALIILALILSWILPEHEEDREIREVERYRTYELLPPKE